MPYCRRCGTPLRDYDRFCPKCGTPVLDYTSPPMPISQPTPSKPLHKEPYVVAAIILVVVIVVAAVVVAFLFAPFSQWSVGQNLQDSSPGITTVYLNFDTNVGRVNLMTQKIGANNVFVHVSANGSRGFLDGNSENPVTITFENTTVGDVLSVNCAVDVKNQFSLQSSVVCDIFVDPRLDWNLDVSSSRGQVSFTADKATIIQTLSLHSNTGEVQANLQGNAAVAGDISLTTNTGAVHYRMSETPIEGNCTIDLQSNTGSVYMDITQTRTLQGNLQVTATTDTGSINVGLNIDNGVGAKITSQTGEFGDINVEDKNFSGDKSPLQSNNYPAASNIEIYNRVTGFGSININAAYLTLVTPV